MGKYFWCKKDFMVVEIVRLYVYWYFWKEIVIKIVRNIKNLKKILCNFFLFNEINYILKFKVDL